MKKLTNSNILNFEAGENFSFSLAIRMAKERKRRKYSKIRAVRKFFEQFKIRAPESHTTRSIMFWPVYQSFAACS